MECLDAAWLNVVWLDEYSLNIGCPNESCVDERLEAECLEEYTR